MTVAAMSVSSTDGPTVTLAYDAANRLTSLSRRIPHTGQMGQPDPQTITTFTYDNGDRISTITHTYVPSTGSSSTLATYTYNYNAASELTSESHQDGLFTYTYSGFAATKAA